MTSFDELRAAVALANPVPQESTLTDLEYAQALAAVEERFSEHAVQERREPQRRIRPAWAAAAAAILVILLVALPMLFMGGGEQDPATTTIPPSTTTTVVVPITESFGRVGAEVMDPVVGLFDIAATETGFVAVGFDPGDNMRQDGVIFVSRDGVEWSRVAEGDPALEIGAVLIYGVTEGGPGVVAVGMGCEDEVEQCVAHPTVWTSTDGTEWVRSAADPAVFASDIGVHESGAMLDVIATDEGLIAAGNIGAGEGDAFASQAAVWSSADGVTWSREWVDSDRIATSPYVPGIVALAPGPGGSIVGAGNAEDPEGNTVAAFWISTDGGEWERAAHDPEVFPAGSAALDVSSGPRGYVAVGSVGGEEAAIWRSQDGRIWEFVDTPSQPFDNVASLGAVAALEEGFAAAGPHGFNDRYGGTVTLWTSPDGERWDRVQAIDAGYAMEILVTDRGVWVAGGTPSEENYHAAVWVGPPLDPADPGVDPQPPAPDREVPEQSVVGKLEDGLSCDDLAAQGFSYAEAVAYWSRYSMTEDVDLNGIAPPCEASYSADEVAAVFGPADGRWIVFVSDIPTSSFTAAGPAVEAGMVCRSGAQALTEGIGEMRPGGLWRWEDLYTCDDGSGNLILGADVLIEADGREHGVWNLVGMTGSYTNLAGGGAVLTGPSTVSDWSDIAVGRVTIIEPAGLADRGDGRLQVPD